MIACPISDGGGRIMLRIPSSRTANSQSPNMARLMPMGQPNSLAYRRSLAAMARLDRFSQPAHVPIEALVLGHSDVAWTGEIDDRLLHDRRRAPSHHQHAVREEGRLADTV